MIRKIILSLIGVGLVYWCDAQSLSPAVISGGGTVSQGKNVQLEWTLGELAVQSIRTDSGLITEGFHQPTLKVEALSRPNDSPEVVFEPSTEHDLNITVAPNPVNSILSIQIESDLDQLGQIFLTNLAGQRLQQLETPFFDNNLEWDFSQFPSGMYLLTFFTKDGTLLKTFKVTKVQ